MRKRKDAHVAPQFISVKSRLVMYNVGEESLRTHRPVERLKHELGVIPMPFKIAQERLLQDTSIHRASV
jgi:hypothetical protein